MKITFPPKDVAHGSKIKFAIDGEEGYTNLDGTPTIIPLYRLAENDKSIRGSHTNECCTCGSVHLYAYEVFSHKKRFYLQKRAYLIKDGKIKSKKKKK